jgi:hypothetical protein
MAALYPEAIDDFVELTLNKMKMGQWKDISMPLQRYTFADRLFKDKVKKPELAGPRCEWKLRVRNQGNATHSGLFHVDKSNRKNVMTNGKQEWSMQTVNYPYDIGEDVFQQGATAIIRMLDLHEQGLLNDFYELMETACWTAPSGSTQNPRPPSGLPFWIQKNSTLGFTGGDPTGFADGAGTIATATYPAWCNYVAPYTAITRDDLVEKLINAMDFCYFKPPVQYREIAPGPPDWSLYSVHSVLATCRRLLQAGNDNLGTDVAAFGGNVLVRGTPLEWVPALSNSDSDAYDSSAPIYGVNWATFECVFKQGWSMRKFAPFQAPNQSNVRIRKMDNWGQIVCYDRRANFVAYVA